MNLSNLKYVVEVEKTGSITKAAQNFYMNQPHVSRIIRELEKELGFSIFDRTGRGMVPTEKGAEFLRYAKVILVQEEQIESLRQTAGEAELAIRLAAPRTSYIPAAVSLFFNQQKNGSRLNVSYLETQSRETVRKVAAREFDLGIIRCQRLYLPYYQKMIQEENLESRSLWNFSCRVFFSSVHPLADKTDLTYLDLLPYIHLTLNDSPSPDFSFGTPEEKKNAGPGIHSITLYDRSSQLDFLCRIPESYMWDAPMPRETLDTLGLTEKACTCPGNSYYDLLVWHSSHRFSQEEQELISCLNRIIGSLS